MANGNTAEGGSRTPTPKAPDPKSGVSTSFTTPADDALAERKSRPLVKGFEYIDLISERQQGIPEMIF